MHNLQQNFTRMGDHVQNVHNQTMNHLTVNAPRVIQVAAQFGTSILDAYSAVAEQGSRLNKRPPPAGDEPLAITNAPGPPPPPPAPDASRIKRAAIAIQDRPVRPSDPPAPAPLEPPTTPAPKRPLPLTDMDRDLPSGPIENKKKPRALAIEDKSDEPGARPKKVEPKKIRVHDRGGDADKKDTKPVYGFVPGVRKTIQKRKSRTAEPDAEPEPDPDPEVLKSARTTRKHGSRAAGAQRFRGRVRIAKVA